MGIGKLKIYENLSWQCKTCKKNQNREYKQLKKHKDPVPQITLPTLAEPSRKELYVLENAACRGDRRFVYTPEQGKSFPTELRNELTKVCNQCPVAKECREEGDRIETAFTFGDDSRWFSGFRAGETAYARAKRRKEERESQRTRSNH
jgi:hypothetical protein